MLEYCALTDEHPLIKTYDIPSNLNFSELRIKGNVYFASATPGILNWFERIGDKLEVLDIANASDTVVKLFLENLVLFKTLQHLKIDVEKFY